MFILKIKSYLGRFSKALLYASKYSFEHCYSAPLKQRIHLLYALLRPVAYVLLSSKYLWSYFEFLRFEIAPPMSIWYFSK